MYGRVDKKKIKSSRKEYVIRTCLNFDLLKTFSVNYKPVSLIMACDK